MPPGLTGRLASVPLCSAAAAASGGCAADSRIGSTVVEAGADSAPFPLTGAVYLTEGYGGAPLGLSIVVRAIAGPFDLGTVVVRAAVSVDQRDAHFEVISDPLPTILQGRGRALGAVELVRRPGLLEPRVHAEDDRRPDRARPDEAGPPPGPAREAHAGSGRGQHPLGRAAAAAPGRTRPD
jgi:hypothetical protein